MSQIVTLSRDCEATRIPYGDKLRLPSGTRVEITQSLGGTYTVMTDEGIMASIAGKDADALGRKDESALSEAEYEGKSDEEKVWAQLKKCFDPEIPHNIVDLGLVYDMSVSELPESQKKVYIKMTLTAPGCGMGDWLKRDVIGKVSLVPGVKDVEVDLVFDPPWDKSRVNERLKPYLGID